MTHRLRGHIVDEISYNPVGNIASGIDRPYVQAIVTGREVMWYGPGNRRTDRQTANIVRPPGDGVALGIDIREIRQIAEHILNSLDVGICITGIAK